mgnify:CR=1 FL=1
MPHDWGGDVSSHNNDQGVILISDRYLKALGAPQLIPRHYSDQWPVSKGFGNVGSPNNDQSIILISDWYPKDLGAPQLIM